MTIDVDEPPDEYDEHDEYDAWDYTDEPEPEPLTAGPLTAEAVRLVTSLQEWVRRTATDAQSADGHTGPECQWCPLCQFVAVLRGERPEVTERVAEAGVAIASALRSLLDATAGATPAGAHRAEERSEADDETPAPRVQRITLGDTFGSTGTG